MLLVAIDMIGMYARHMEKVNFFPLPSTQRINLSFLQLAAGNPLTESQADTGEQCPFVGYQYHHVNQIGEGVGQDHQGQVAPAFLKEPAVAQGGEKDQHTT